MKDKAFIDTNVLIYLFSEDEPEKKVRSQGVFDKYDCITSIQTLNELSNVLSKKFKIISSDISSAIDEIAANCHVVAIGVNTIKSALEISAKYRYSYYDSLIISSALENECTLLLSEDMQRGQLIEGNLIIQNIYT